MIRNSSPLLAALCLSLIMLAGCKPTPEGSQDTPVVKEPSPLSLNTKNILYISPGGSDTATGGRAHPLATLSRAMERLAPGEKGAILLLGGIYTGKLEVNARAGEHAPLIIAAAPGEEVIYEGGSVIERWEPWEGDSRLFVVTTAPREGMFNAPVDSFFDVWDDEMRIRFRKAFDPAGVKAWPNSVCLLDDGRLLIHPADPTALSRKQLWVNRVASGASISRPNTTLEGLHFRNYLGGDAARALTVGKVEGVTIRHCTFTNSAIGISSSGIQTLVEGCTLREMGLGIRHGHGREMTVRDCLIEAATGLFASNDVSEHLRDGIRIYFPADGATVERCVTAGFWAGLYIKTISADPGSLPYHVSNNTFLDGIRAGAGIQQPRSTYTRNIVGPATGDGVAPNGGYLRQMGATLVDNYFYESGEGAQPTAPPPFVDAAKGDLRLKPNLPGEASPETLGAPRREVPWSKRLARALSPEPTQPAQTSTLAWVTGPNIASTREGALLSASLNAEGNVTVRYRKRGTDLWKTVRALPLFKAPREAFRAAAPFELPPPTEFPYIAALTRGELEANTEYDFTIEASTEGENSPPTSLEGGFATRGEPRTLHAPAFPSLQAALNHALPGDRIELGEGIFTHPVILTHGGTAEKPLIVSGAGATTTILDGGRQTGVMVELRNAPHVHFQRLAVRQYGDAAIKVVESPGFTLAEAWIYNGPIKKTTGTSGHGVWLDRSPGATITHSLFTRTETGVVAVKSPGIKLLNNTAFGNLYAGIALIESCDGSVVERNSFNFTGNQAMRVRVQALADLDTFRCNENNYGSLHRDNAKVNKTRSAAGLSELRPENDFTPAERYGPLSQVKQIIELTVGKKVQTFHRMVDWRAVYPGDQRSLYADPEFADPQNGDFRLLPGSPNLLQGAFIGAFPAK